ncbi:MAG: RluA family pseudouridine synthase [Candidatus Staskawiczbacteria bacterium]|nr:RluA family pseudouridine synthase [Candidatus Staskawiczbacteria bacterium]
MGIKIIYEDNDLLVVDKPAGIVVFPEGESVKSGEKTLIDYLIEKYPELKNVGEAPRYGIVHRLDKDTSGVLLVAKTQEALIFLQNQFINRKVEKKYVCLVEGVVNDDSGKIETLIARSKKDFRKQVAISESQRSLPAGRQAITEYKVLERFSRERDPAVAGKDSYTLLEVEIKTGRRHQIRCHLSYLKHPIAGDKLYSFKNSKIPEGLTRQFLHASYLKIQLPSGKIKEFSSELPEELEKIINKLARQ